jgi:hypothetical protein
MHENQAEGGSGGATAPGIRTTRLVERALRESWPIPEDLRPLLVRRLAHIVESDNSSPREVTSAAKAILSASKINLDAVGVAISAEQHEELTERLEKLEQQINSERRP